MSACLSANIRRALWEYPLGVGTWLSHSELQNPISHTKPPQHVSFMSKQNNLKCSTIHNVLLFVTWVHRFTTRFTYPLSLIMFWWWIFCFNILEYQVNQNKIVSLSFCNILNSLILVIMYIPLRLFGIYVYIVISHGHTMKTKVWVLSMSSTVNYRN